MVAASPLSLGEYGHEVLISWPCSVWYSKWINPAADLSVRNDPGLKPRVLTPSLSPRLSVAVAGQDNMYARKDLQTCRCRSAEADRPCDCHARDLHEVLYSNSDQDKTTRQAAWMPKVSNIFECALFITLAYGQTADCGRPFHILHITRCMF